MHRLMTTFLSALVLAASVGVTVKEPSCSAMEKTMSCCAESSSCHKPEAPAQEEKERTCCKAVNEYWISVETKTHKDNLTVSCLPATPPFEFTPDTFSQPDSTPVISNKASPHWWFLEPEGLQRFTI